MDKRKLPPVWYSKLELFFISRKLHILVLLYFLIFFVWPFFQGTEQLDPQLLQGIDE